MTAILKHNLDMPWQTSPAQDRITLKKARLTPRPFTLARRAPWGPAQARTTPAEIERGRKARTNPAVLRALREAEMAVWNRTLPDTTIPAATRAAIPVREVRIEIVATEKAEGRVYYIIAAIAALAVVQGLWGLSTVLDHWSALVGLVQRIFTA